MEDMDELAGSSDKNNLEAERAKRLRFPSARALFYPTHLYQANGPVFDSVRCALGQCGGGNAKDGRGTGGRGGFTQARARRGIMRELSLCLFAAGRRCRNGGNEGEANQAKPTRNCTLSSTS